MVNAASILSPDNKVQFKNGQFVALCFRNVAHALQTTDYRQKKKTEAVKTFPQTFKFSVQLIFLLSVSYIHKTSFSGYVCPSDQ